MVVAGKKNAKGTVGDLTVAASGEEAAYATEGVRYRDTAGCDRNYLRELACKTAAEDDIDEQEAHNTADESADKGKTARKAKSPLGIFQIIVEGVKERRRAKANGNRRYCVIETKIEKFNIYVKTLAVKIEHRKGTKYPHRDHNAIHMNIKKYWIR